MRRIPVYATSDGATRMVDAVTPEQAVKLVDQRKAVAKYGRRGHLKAIYLSVRLTGLIHLERDGLCIKQTLGSVLRVR